MEDFRLSEINVLVSSKAGFYSHLRSYQFMLRGEFDSLLSGGTCPATSDELSSSL
jgi:hypothetical protein